MIAAILSKPRMEALALGFGSIATIRGIGGTVSNFELSA